MLKKLLIAAVMVTSFSGVVLAQSALTNPPAVANGGAGGAASDNQRGLTQGSGYQGSASPQGAAAAAGQPSSRKNIRQN